MQLTAPCTETEAKADKCDSVGMICRIDDIMVYIMIQLADRKQTIYSYANCKKKTLSRETVPV